MPRPANDRILGATVQPALSVLEQDFKRRRKAAKSPGFRYWNVRIIDYEVVQPADDLQPEDLLEEEPMLLVEFTIYSENGGGLYIDSWSVTGTQMLSSTETRTPLHTYARVAVRAVEDALAIEAAHGPDNKLMHEPEGVTVAFTARLAEGKLELAKGEYPCINGQLQDARGEPLQPRPRRLRSVNGNDELQARIPRAVEEYRRAIGRGSRSPTVDVARELHVGRSTAARAIAEARRQGLLGPARRTSAGELRSV